MCNVTEQRLWLMCCCFLWVQTYTCFYFITLIYERSMKAREQSQTSRGDILRPLGGLCTCLCVCVHTGMWTCFPVLTSLCSLSLANQLLIMKPEPPWAYSFKFHLKRSSKTQMFISYNKCPFCFCNTTRFDPVTRSWKWFRLLLHTQFFMALFQKSFSIISRKSPKRKIRCTAGFMIDRWSLMTATPSNSWDSTLNCPWLQPQSSFFRSPCMPICLVCLSFHPSIVSFLCLFSLLYLSWIMIRSLPWYTVIDWAFQLTNELAPQGHVAGQLWY